MDCGKQERGDYTGLTTTIFAVRDDPAEVVHLPGFGPFQVKLPGNKNAVGGRDGAGRGQNS